MSVIPSCWCDSIAFLLQFTSLHVKKLLQKYFGLRRHRSEIILPEIISKLFQKHIAAQEA